MMEMLILITFFDLLVPDDCLGHCRISFVCHMKTFSVPFFHTIYFFHLLRVAEPKYVLCLMHRHLKTSSRNLQRHYKRLVSLWEPWNRGVDLKQRQKNNCAVKSWCQHFSDAYQMPHVKFYHLLMWETVSDCMLQSWLLCVRQIKQIRAKFVWPFITTTQMANGKR